MENTRQALLAVYCRPSNPGLSNSLSYSDSVTAEVLLLKDTPVSPLRTEQLLLSSIHHSAQHKGFLAFSRFQA